jgi:hypothetical protein
LGDMQLVYITHAFGRRITESNFVSAPLLHDLFGDPTLRGQLRASIGDSVFLILPNTQRIDKVQGRKGKRASIVVEFRSRCASRWSIGVWWRSPFFAVVMLHELLVKMFEGVNFKLSQACYHRWKWRPGAG